MDFIMDHTCNDWTLHRWYKHPVILVADDDRLVARAIARRLEHAGFEVATSSDGREALLSLSQRTFDLVISDLSMPLAGGLAILESVHRNQPDLPVIIMSGDLSGQSAARAFALGAFRCLEKPIEPDRLIQVVGVALATHRSARSPKSR
jgi:DNA-binding NtrC family response regulator